MSAATTGLLAAAVLTACGTTGDSSDGSATAAVTQKAESGQICSQSSTPPGYTDGVATIAGQATQVSGAGSTFVAPMMSVWTKNYASLDGVQVAYQSIGSGGGVAQITAKTVDFGDSDTAMSDTELAAAPGAILHVPVVTGGVVATYNLKGVTGTLQFTGEVLGEIFAGKITTWNDPALVELNKDAKLPDEPIAVVHRSDGSGTTGVWTDYLTKESPQWVSALGGATQSKGKTVAWPVGIGGKGNEGVSGAVQQTEGAIGYVELQYALAQNLPVGLVQNKDKTKFVQPCVATLAAAADQVTLPDDLRASITDQPGDDSYPITGTTYVLIYQDQTDKAKGAALVNFLSWVLTKGQDQAAALNYAPLGETVQKQAVGQLKKVTAAGSALAAS